MIKRSDDVGEVKSGEVVILLHGLFSSALLLKPLEWRLRGLGYVVENWNYPGFGGVIEDHGKRLWDKLMAYDGDEGVDRIHLVGHSMGGIVIRSALSLGLPRKLHRVVMIATPNKGSHVARILNGFAPWLSRMLGQISDADDSFVNRLPWVIEGEGGGEFDLEIGLLMARHDRSVRRSSVDLGNWKDRAIVPSLHSLTLLLGETHRQVAGFLDRGEFDGPRRG